MKYIYTATFVPNEDETKYYCRVPDLPGCITTAGSIDEAIELITDAASGWLVVAEDEGNIIPAATPQHMLDIPENAACSIIRMDGCSCRKTGCELLSGSPGRTDAAAQYQPYIIKTIPVRHKSAMLL